MTEAEAATESNGQENNKGEGNVEDETELESKIIRQVEYYFGDANLPRDKFLREQVKLDNGWIPLDILIKFNRLASLTTDLDVIANALNKSSNGLVEVSEDNKKVRRNPEMPLPEMNEERRKEVMGCTIYAKGFPKDSTLDDLMKFFKEHGEVEIIIMRKYQDRQTKKRHFKGSVFAQFKTKEEAVKFLESKELKYGDTELIRRWQEDYFQEKQKEYQARKEKKEKSHKSDSKEQKPEFKLPTGTVLHFSEGSDKMTREDIREAMAKLGVEANDISFIDFKVGEKEGWLRMSKENLAREIFAKITDGKIKIGESEVVFKLLEGDEEKAYLDKTVEEMTKRRKVQKTNKNKGRNFSKGKGKKRRQDQSDDGPPAKTKAVES